jgi:hypothetical protein
MSTHPDHPAPSAADPKASKDRFRSTLIKVLSVQVVTLLIFWLLQARYGL